MSNRSTRGKGPQRLLYWFRTPPGVRVGRSALDEEAIRLLEQHNPDIQFDWSRILREPAPQPPPRKEERRGRDRDRRGGPRDARPTPPRPPRVAGEAALPAAEHTERPEEGTGEYLESTEWPGEVAAEYMESTERPEEVATEYTEYTERPEVATGYSPEPVESLERLELAEADALEPRRREPEPAESREPGERREPASAAEARVGTEGLARLRARYAEIMARIAERPLDEEAREQLKQRAERLNPDTWVTADEVAEALEVYESVYDELRAVVGTRHRRRRGRRRDPQQ